MHKFSIHLSDCYKKPVINIKPFHITLRYSNKKPHADSIRVTKIFIISLTLAPWRKISPWLVNEFLSSHYS